MGRIILYRSLFNLISLIHKCPINKGFRRTNKGFQANLRQIKLSVLMSRRDYNLIDNGKLIIDNYFFSPVSFVDFTILTSNLISSLQSSTIDENTFHPDTTMSCKSINQYSVSFASFKATLILLIKSALDWACSASLIKAPIDVPIL